MEDEEAEPIPPLMCDKEVMDVDVDVDEEPCSSSIRGITLGVA